MTSRKLLHCTRDSTMLAGPRENALFINIMPIVFRMDENIPTKKSRRLKEFYSATIVYSPFTFDLTYCGCCQNQMAKENTTVFTIVIPLIVMFVMSNRKPLSGAVMFFMWITCKLIWNVNTRASIKGSHSGILLPIPRMEGMSISCGWVFSI